MPGCSASLDPPGCGEIGRNLCAVRTQEDEKFLYGAFTACLIFSPAVILKYLT